MTRRTLLTDLVAVAALLAVGGIVLAVRGRNATKAPPAPLVLDVGTVHYGKTYPEWASTWWRWLYETPQHGDRCILPDDDMSGANCAHGQTDPDVFFLVGTRGAKVVRTKCVVPKGRAIFFPIVTWVNDNGGVLPENVLTEQQMFSGVTLPIDRAVGLSLKVDGAEIDVTKQRVAATKFSYTLPQEPNYYSCVGTRGVTGRIDVAYEAGYWVMLAPLSPGPHELAFTARIPQSLGDFVIDVLYRFRVE